ncbi:MAG: PEGA domain-containing protein [Myxococcales bacterium]|nr:PEGA domain-containing protein [Myxococcales bacterium]
MTRTLAAMTCVAALLHAPPATAQDDPRWADAEARFAEAQAEFDRQNYDGALASFTHIHDLLETHPRAFFVLFNIGLCQEHLFRYDEALASYQAFLTQGRAYARQHGEPLQREADAQNALTQLEARLATLEVAVNVGRAEVWVDQRRVGTAPGPVRVAEGTHVVELRASGHAPGRQQISIAARTTQPMSFTLERSFGGLSPAFVITGAALTAIAAGIGIGFGASALAEQGLIDEQLGSSDPTERFRVTQARIDANAETALIADVFFATAGVLGIATVVLVFVTDWGGGEGADRARLAPWVDPNGGGLAVGGTF